MNEYSVIGKRLPRVDGVAKATGEAKYGVDLVLPRMLYAKVLRSPYAHARILNIDTSRAEKLPGVKAVTTGKDLVSMGYRVEPDTGAEPGLAIGKVRYWGEGVAAVAATDENIAAEALDLIKVEYEELPPLLDTEQAMREGTPRIHDNRENNIIRKVAYNFGDVEKGFTESSYIREDTLTTQDVHACYTEPLACVADFDAGGKLTLWTSCQSAYDLKRWVAAHFGMEPARVRVIAPYLGGGHCSRVVMLPHQVCAATLAMKANRPVKIECSREETFITHRGAQPTIVKLKTGIKQDGTLVAMQCDVVMDFGAYSETRPTFVHYYGSHLHMLYRLPNLKFSACLVNTNNSPYFAQRGSGHTAAGYAMEAHLDMVATASGMDPAEFRLKNALRSGDRMANNHMVPSSGLSECIQKVVEVIRWKEKRGKLAPGRGIGIACYAHPTGATAAFTPANVLVHVHQDSTVTVITGANDNGQGSSTILSQIVAEELGVGIKDIRVTQPDTDITPFDPGANGSRCTFLTGNAARLAAVDAKQQILELAARKLGVKAEELELRNKQVYVRKNPEKNIPLTTVLNGAQTSQPERMAMSIMGKGAFARDYAVVNAATDEGGAATYSFGAMAAEVEVDKETGLVKVCEAVMAHDCGLALNPMSVEGQMEGQIQIGMGQALYENLVRDKGKMLNPNFMDYRMPRPLDMPKVRTVIVETKDPTSPLGVKEVGEGPQGGVAPAIANAIYDAIGVRINDLPITPEKTLKALNQKGKGKC